MENNKRRSHRSRTNLRVNFSPKRMSSLHPIYIHQFSSMTFRKACWPERKAFSCTVLESILQLRKLHESEEQEHAKRKNVVFWDCGPFKFQGLPVKSRSLIPEAMAEVLDELGYPREVTKEEVVSAFCQVIDPCQTHNCTITQPIFEWFLHAGNGMHESLIDVIGLIFDKTCMSDPIFGWNLPFGAVDSKNPELLVRPRPPHSQKSITETPGVFAERWRRGIIAAHGCFTGEKLAHRWQI